MVSPTLAAPWSAAGAHLAVLSTLTAGEGASLVTVAVEGALGGLVTPSGSRAGGGGGVDDGSPRPRRPG